VRKPALDEDLSGAKLKWVNVHSRRCLESSGLTVPLKHKALLLLALARAVFRPILAPLYGMSAVSGDKANGPSCVSTIIVIAHGGDGHPGATERNFERYLGLGSDES